MNFLDQALDVISGVIERPTANLTLTVLLLAVLTLVFLVLDVAILLLVSPRRKRRVRKTIRRWVPDASSETAGGSTPTKGMPAGDADAPVQADDSHATDTPAATRRPWWHTVGLVMSSAVVPLLIIGSLVTTYVVTGVEAVCTESCHAESAAVSQIHEKDHRYRASCIECHEQGSGADMVTAVMARGTMLLAEAGLTDTAPNRPVASAACVRCHEDVLRGVLESSRVNVRMSHEQPVTSGMDCVDCHGSVGHLGESARVAVSMDACLACHDGEAAPTECETCHTTDIAAVGRDSLSSDETRITGSGRFQYPPVEVAVRDCGGCHDLEMSCDPCHGLRLPHPDRFVEGYHAKDAAWSRKETCFRCHSEVQDCQQCHAPFTTGHIDTWVRDHQAAAWDAGCGCHGRGSNEDIPICVFCHDDAPSQTVGEEHITRP